MHTKDLCAIIGKRLNIPRIEAEKKFKIIINVIEEQLLDGKEVNLVKFGKFIPVIVQPKRKMDTFSGNKREIDCQGKILVKFKHFRNSRKNMYENSNLAKVQAVNKEA